MHYIYRKSLNGNPQLLPVQLNQILGSRLLFEARLVLGHIQYRELATKCNRVYKHFVTRLISPQIVSDINNVRFSVFL